MRWILALVALVAGIWLLRNRQRLRLGGQDTVPNLRDVATAARERASSVQPQAAETISRVADAARSAGSAVAGKAQELASTAGQRAGDAAASVQEASGAVVDRVQQAAGTAAEGEGKTTAADTSATAQADVDTSAPSVAETMKAELADVGEKVEGIRAQAQAPAETTEKSAGTAFGTGTMSSTDMKTTPAPGPTDTEQEPQGDGGPGGRRRRRIAGEGTTTATGGAVDPFAPSTPDQTSTGVAEPLPAGLTPGEPGTGGPAGSSKAPSEPDSAETPTTGMEQLPEIDRAAEVLQRTSGNFIGNKNTRVFHAATASNLPGEDNRVYFESEEEALAAGFQPAKNEGLESADA